MLESTYMNFTLLMNSSTVLETLATATSLASRMVVALWSSSPEA